MRALAPSSPSSPWPSVPGAAQDPDIWPDHAATDEETAATGREAMPFTQEQIRLLGALLQQVREATADGRRRAAGGTPAPPADPPRRGRRCPVVHLVRGYTSAITFTDITGEPWPIEEVLVDSVVPARTAPTPGHPARSTSSTWRRRRSHLHGNALVKLAHG